MPSLGYYLGLAGLCMAGFVSSQSPTETTVTADGIPLPTPLSIDPDQNWDGDDGPWSSFTIGIGTPLQFVRVFVSTASQQTWAVIPEGCYSAAGTDPSTAASNIQTCQGTRGWAYNFTASTTFDPVGIFALYIEENLGYWGNAQYGTDTLYLGSPGGSGPTEMNATIGATAGLDFYLGIFGVHPKPTNFTSFLEPYPSYMTLLKNDAQIPSLSFGYTAGAQYRYTGVLASLTLGGYDDSLFTDNNLTFVFAPNNERDLVVGLQSITSNVTGETNLLGNRGVYAFIDSTVGAIWLPTAVCQQFEQAFGLVYDSTTELYLVNTTLHNQLLDLNPTITFTMGAETVGGDTVDIVFPYAAFDKMATPPFQNMTNSSLYFPLRRASQSNQITLGRTFLQEAYLSVDWERQIFNVSQNDWKVNPQKNIITIPPLNTTVLENNPQYLAQVAELKNPSLGAGAIAGIVVGAVAGVVIVGVILLLLYRRRVKRRLAALPTQRHAADNGTGRSGSSSDDTLHGQSMAQMGSGIVIPKAELDASVPPTFAKLVGDDYEQSHAGSGTLRPDSSTVGGSPMGTLIGAGSPLASPTASHPPGSPRIPRTVLQVGGLQEAENSEREVYEMPGDVPAPVEMPGPGQLDETAKEMDIAREREYNGVSPSERA